MSHFKINIYVLLFEMFEVIFKGVISNKAMEIF